MVAAKPWPPSPPRPPTRVLTSVARAWSSPAAWHFLSLAVGFAYIAWLQRDQWFFFDEWAFLEPRHPGLLAPHVGHWSTSPLALFLAYRSHFGMGSYVPYAVTVTLIHIAVVHLIWRVSLRSRVEPWIATAAVSVLLVLGAGAENILWAFQIGFLGALALGLLAFLLATYPNKSAGGYIAIIAISAFALTWSGTAIPMVMATAAMIFRRTGTRKAVAYAAVTAGVYLAWYLFYAVGSDSNPDTGGFDPVKLLVKVPVFIGVMLILGFPTILPIPGLGFLLLVALVAWLLRARVRRVHLPGLSPALILAGAAAVFALLTAFSRAEFSLGGGRASRYVYILVVLLLPLCGVALTRLAETRPSSRGYVLGALGAVCLYQAFVLHAAAERQAIIEQDSRRLISAAISLAIAEPGAVNPAAVVDTSWAPDVTLEDLVELHMDGVLPVSDFGDSDLDRARAAVWIGP